MKEFQSVSSDFGLTVSILKMKHLVTGREADDCDKTPIPVNGGEIAGFEKFPYLRSIIEKINEDVITRKALAS